MGQWRRCGAAVAFAAALALSGCAGPPVSASAGAAERLSGDIVPVHDPVIIEADGTYYLFTTGHLRRRSGLVPVRTSTDLGHWTLIGPAFAGLPAWAEDAVPGVSGMWAPDISRTNDEYRLYYSLSTFGKNRSAIGFASSPTLDPAAPDYGWTDRGLVIASTPEDDYNAIDPNIFTDDDGRQWLTFGSFWSGLKLIELDPATGKPKPGAELHSIAQRPGGPGAVEAPFLIKRGGHYYLFASYDFCCRREKSSYYTVVGRAEAVTGPYLDRQGRPMLEGHAETVLHPELQRSDRFVGPGHPALLEEQDRTLIVYHAYDTESRGASTLRIADLEWTKEGWPVVPGQ